VEGGVEEEEELEEVEEARLAVFPEEELLLRNFFPLPVVASPSAGVAGGRARDGDGEGDGDGDGEGEETEEDLSLLFPKKLSLFKGEGRRFELQEEPILFLGEEAEESGEVGGEEGGEGGVVGKTFPSNQG
jgi:hypothetical protein